MFLMPNADPREFRRNVAIVAMDREAGVNLEKIAADFGIDPITLSAWLKPASVEHGIRLGISPAGSAELREANKRIRLLEQEAEVLKRALAHVP
jgi:transposase-like protein